MYQTDSTTAPLEAPAPAIPFTDLRVQEKWSIMEHRMSHPLLQALRGLRTGTLRLYLPDGSEVFYLGTNAGPHASIRFHDWKAMDRMAGEGEVAWGEDFTQGLWETADLGKLMQFAAQNAGIFHAATGASPFSKLARFARRKLLPGAASRPELHPDYALTNDFYRLWLDETMTLSSAMFQDNPDTPLEEAQRAKYRRILARLDPQRGEHILDLGCGWGAFMEESARRGFQTTGASFSGSQAAFAQERLEGFGGLAEVRLHEDSRRLGGAYDYVISLGMFEHIRAERAKDYMDCIFRNLRPGGKAMIETIIIPDKPFASRDARQGFLREHMFPGSSLPSRRCLERESERAGLRVAHVLHLGKDCAATHEEWLNRFDRNADKIRSLGYCENFIRKWRFHLASTAALLGAGQLDALQMELSRPLNG